MLPTSESTRRSCTSLPNRARTYSPIESLSVEVRGSSGSSAARALPLHDSRRVVASGRSRPGTPSSSPSGIACSPSSQTAAPTASGDTRSSPRPTRRASATASGTRARKASAPSSTWATPANGLVSMRPPTRSAASNTTTSAPVSASITPSAAERPLIPPPTTATRRDMVLNPRRRPSPALRVLP